MPDAEKARLNLEAGDDDLRVLESLPPNYPGISGSWTLVAWNPTVISAGRGGRPLPDFRHLAKEGNPNGT